MKKRQNISIFPLLIVGVFLLFASSCKEDEENVQTSVNPTNGKTTAVFNNSISYGTMTDQDSNVYKTVTIGTQTWMAENLRTTKYNDGTSIPIVTDDDQWEALKTGAYCNYKNTTVTDTIATNGRLYNWYAVNTGKLAPAGWHVPSDEEWITLTTYLGGDSVAGGKLKESGTSHWNSPNITATNETGFTALPGGYRTNYGIFTVIRDLGYWWSATEDSTNNAWHRYLNNDSGNAYEYYEVKEAGMSVRCVKD